MVLHDGIVGAVRQMISGISLPGSNSERERYVPGKRVNQARLRAFLTLPQNEHESRQHVRNIT